VTRQIDPPPKLVYDWAKDRVLLNDSTPLPEYIATRAAQWGADQELKACCEWLVSEGWFKYEHEAVEDLRAARRPKPPSLKEQALSSLTQLVVDLDRANMRDQATILEGPIRRALEQLDD
jgi:hypothetical protein